METCLKCAEYEIELRKRDEAHLNLLREYRQKSATVRHWQKFVATLAKKLGCIGIDDDILKTVDDLESQLAQAKQENHEPEATLKDCRIELASIDEALGSGAGHVLDKIKQAKQEIERLKAERHEISQAAFAALKAKNEG